MRSLPMRTLLISTPLPESEPEEDSGFDFSETEDEEEAAAEDDELSGGSSPWPISNHRLG